MMFYPRKSFRLTASVPRDFQFVAVLHSSVLNKQLYCSKISLSRYSVVSVRGRQIVSLCGLLVDRSLGAV